MNGLNKEWVEPKDLLRPPNNIIRLFLSLLKPYLAFYSKSKSTTILVMEVKSTYKVLPLFRHLDSLTKVQSNYVQRHLGIPISEIDFTNGCDDK